MKRMNVTKVVPMQIQLHYPFAVPLNIVGTGQARDSEVLYSMAVGIKSWLSTPNYLLVLLFVVFPIDPTGKRAAAAHK